MPLEVLVDHLLDHLTTAADHATSALSSAADHASSAVDHVANHATDIAGVAVDHAHAAADHVGFGALGHEWVPGSSGVLYERIDGIYTGNWMNP